MTTGRINQVIRMAFRRRRHWAVKPQRHQHSGRRSSQARAAPPLPRFDSSFKALLTHDKPNACHVAARGRQLEQITRGTNGGASTPLCIARNRDATRVAEPPTGSDACQNNRQTPSRSDYLASGNLPRKEWYLDKLANRKKYTYVFFFLSFFFF